MIGLPPLLAGAVKVTVACALPAVAVPMVGAPGTPAGVTLFEAAEAGPVPIALVAVTVKVYAVPLVSPVITWECRGAGVAVHPAGRIRRHRVASDRTAAVVGRRGEAHRRLRIARGGGADGRARQGPVAGVTLFEAAEAGPVPIALVALTVKVYAVPLVSPVTT